MHGARSCSLLQFYDVCEICLILCDCGCDLWYCCFRIEIIKVLLKH